MRRDIILSAAILLVVVGVVGGVLYWEYQNDAGLFWKKDKARVVVFDAEHGTPTSRVLVASGKCIFTVGEEYAWVEVGKPYLVKYWVERGRSNVLLHLVSIEPYDTGAS